MAQSIIWRESFIAATPSILLSEPSVALLHVTHSKSSPATASGLFSAGIFSAGNAANLADAATIADGWFSSFFGTCNGIG
jgi:hypothetical protein